MNRSLATSLTTVTFLIIGISGVMMFFHFFDSSVKQLHEILGLAFVGAVILHLFYNWKSMKSYFRKRTFFAMLIAGTLVSAIFVSMNLNQGTNPKRVIFNSILNAPIEHSYAVLNVNNANEKLQKEGIKVLEENSIKEIAQANKTSPFKIISILTN